MSFTRSIGRNTIIQFAGKLVGTVFGLVTIGLMQRYLSPTGFGAYTVAMAYLGIFSVIADLGLYLILIRELAKPGVDEPRVVGNLLALRWTSAALILSLGAALVWFLPITDPAVKRAVLIGTASFLAVAGTQLLTGIFQTKLAIVRVTTAELLGRIVLLALTWWTVTSDGGLNAIMVAVVGGSVMNFLFVYLSARRYVPLSLHFDRRYWADILRQTFPIAASIVLNLIYFRADTVILAHYASSYAVGLYGAAYKILEILITFDLILIGLLLPMLGAAFARQDRERFVTIFQRGFDLLLMAVIPLLVGGWILARPLLTAIGQEAYAPAAPILRLLLFAVAALFLNGLSNHAVTVINRQRQMVWGYLSVAVVGLIAYFTLIPRFSTYGAATGTILTESLTGLISYILVLRVMRFRLRLRILPKLLVSAAVMGVVVYLLRSANVWLTAVIGAAVYGLALIATRALRLSTVREIIASRQANPDVITPL